MNAFKEQFLQDVADYETIAVYRHQFADGDALGSQWGLITWLRKRYPQKTIVAMGDNDFKFEAVFPRMDNPLLEVPFLAIIVDTANRGRIDGSSYEQAAMTLKIDHHPAVDNYADTEVVDASRGSCCEIITDLLLELDAKSLDAISARYLLAGILTDTIRFSIETTSTKTLRSAAALMEYGVDISQLNRDLFNRPYEFFKHQTKIANYVVFEDPVAYFILDQETLAQMDLSAREGKQFLSIMVGIFEFKIWAAFTQTPDGTYIGSVRSQEKTINTICAQFNGGGHRLACGVRDLSREQVGELILALQA